jgi:(heptosyl)LPS beta-1,4-glucosyltransferase
MDATLPISVLLLARDEAERLDALLPRLAFAREVVVVIDAATRDRSRTVAERHGARVFERALDGFGPQRRFALAQCREPWVLWIDADERPDAAAVAGIARLVREGTAAGGRLRRRTWFLGRRIRFCGWRGERVLRVFRREAAGFDDAAVHERVHVAGPVVDVAGTLEHHSYARWEDCREKLVRYAAAGAAEARRAGRRATLAEVLLRPPLRFLRMYLLQLGALDGAHGALLCALAAAQVFLKYAELWARPRSAPDAEPPPAGSP